MTDRWIGCAALALTVIVAGGCGSTGSGAAMPAATDEMMAAAAASGLDFEFYRENVEPIFYDQRTGFDVGVAPCVSCHTFQTTTPLKLEPLQEEGGRVYWTEAQSRRNFAVVARLVTPGDPDASRLLNKPLSGDAGGTRIHTGGTFWDSKDHPEWQRMAEWVRMAPRRTQPPPAEPLPDFAFFRQCVQPIFLNPAENTVPCTSCHSGRGSRSFANAPAEGRSTWTEDEALENYRTLMRLIEPGHPELSRFLHHPLDRAAGGDIMHNGGRRWMSKQDPEWQALASWIRGEATGTDCPAPLRF